MEEDCNTCYNLKPRGYINVSVQNIVESIREGKCHICPLLYDGLRRFDASLYPEKTIRESNLQEEEPLLFPWPEDRFKAAEFYILHGMSQIWKYLTKTYRKGPSAKQQRIHSMRNISGDTGGEAAFEWARKRIDDCL